MEEKEVDKGDHLGHLGLSDPTVFISSFDRLVLVGCALCEYEWID